MKKILFIWGLILISTRMVYTQALPPAYPYEMSPGLRIFNGVNWVFFYTQNDSFVIQSSKPFITFNGHLLYPNQWLSDSASFASKVYVQNAIADSFAAHPGADSAIFSTVYSRNKAISDSITGWSTIINTVSLDSTAWNNATSWVTNYGGNYSDWNTAYSWGNHADAGYLTSFTELDPVYSSSTAANISADGVDLTWNDGSNTQEIAQSAYAEIYFHGSATYSVKNTPKCITGFTEGKMKFFSMSTDSTIQSSSGADGDYRITISGLIARSNGAEPSSIYCYVNSTEVKHTDIFTNDAGTTGQEYFIMDFFYTLDDDDVIKIKYMQSSGGSPSIYVREVNVIIDRRNR